MAISIESNSASFNTFAAQPYPSPLEEPQIANAEDPVNAKVVDFSDLSKITLSQENQRDEIHAAILAEMQATGSRAVTIVRVINQVNTSLEGAKLCLQQGVGSTLSIIQIFLYNEDKRFELAQFSISQDAIATLFYLEKFQLSEEYSFECFKLALEQNADQTIRLLRKLKFSKALQFACLEYGLREYGYKLTKSPLHTIESLGFNKKERMELFRFALQADVYSTAIDLKRFKCSREEKLELFKFALEQSVYCAVSAIQHFDFNEEERFELAQFSLSQDISRTMKSLKKFQLSSKQEDTIATSNPTIEASMQQLIAKTNANKGPNAPICLILQAISDYNFAFQSPSELDTIQEIGKTHRIVFKAIGHRNLWQEIAITARKVDKLIDVLMAKGHGTPNAIRFGFNDQRYITVFASDFKYINPHGRILLDACSTGTVHGIAQKISKVFSGTVFAPIKDSEPISICRVDGELEGFYHDVIGEEITAQFKDGVKLPEKTAQLLAHLRAKEEKSRTAEESFLLGQDYLYRESVARECNLPIIANKCRLMALKCYDHARKMGNYKARHRYFSLKCTP